MDFGFQFILLVDSENGTNPTNKQTRLFDRPFLRGTKITKQPIMHVYQELKIHTGLLPLAVQMLEQWQLEEAQRAERLEAVPPECSWIC